MIQGEDEELQFENIEVDRAARNTRGDFQMSRYKPRAQKQGHGQNANYGHLFVN